MQRTKIIGDQETLSTIAGSASSISSATCVRLFNDHSGTVIVSISTSVGAATTLTFSMFKDEVEFLEKLPTDVIFASHAIKANKVGFTN